MMPGRTEIGVPVDSKVLSVAVQRGKPFVWIEMGVSRQTTSIQLQTIMTGDTFNPGPAWRFIGTLLLEEGSFVLHVYEMQ